MVQVPGGKILLPELDRAHSGPEGLPHDGEEIAVTYLVPIGHEVQAPLPWISKFEIRNSKWGFHYSIIPSIVVEADAYSFFGIRPAR